ncbi:MAG TPA: hypothetical protein VFA59_02230 [Vicinamibacterales bacterium]|nr:hypothetical protein [Vicinamibacterales bacterium]
MTLRTRILMAVLWIGSLVFVGAVATAQTRKDPAAVISGADIGFKPDGWRGNVRTGTWMVKINGEWVEAVGSTHASPATTR